jgi:predicted permease
MSWLQGIRRRLTEALHPRQEDDSLRQELQDHFRREVDRQIRDGLTPDEARRRASARSGSRESAREAVRDERSGRLFEDAAADLRFSARALRRNPGFTAAVVISLALGVGGTTAIFSVVNAVVLRPLPYPDADRLFNMRIWWSDFSSTLSPADFETLDERPDKARFGAYFRPDDGFAMETPAGPVLVSGAIMSAGLAHVLRVNPVLGSGFSSTPNAPEALIGERLWRERYNASPDVIGRAIVLDGDPYSITGVMPEGFNVPGQRDGAAWLKALTRQPTRRGPFYLTTVVRLEPGESPDAAAARFTAEARPLLLSKLGVEPDWEYRLRSMKETIVGDVRPTLLLVLAAMALVLLIAIVNVTNLFLARGTVRARELAVRASLGASRGRLARHLLAESALLGTIGGLFGIWLAAGIHGIGIDAARRILPRIDEVRLDTTVVVFAVACGIASGIVAGTLPALRLPWHRLATFLRDGGRTAGDGIGRGRTRQALVVAEIALTVTVLTGAVLLAKSFVRLQATDPGFEPAGLASFRLSLPDKPYGNEERLGAFLTDLEAKLAAIPGVRSLSYSLALPPDRLVVSNNYTNEGGTPGSQGTDGVAEWNAVSLNYFSTLGIRMLAGRSFTVDDRANGPDVAIVNQTFARRHFPDGNVLGRRFKSGNWDPTGPWTTIVGVAADVPYGRGVWGGADATIYRPYSQSLWSQSLYVVLKTDGDPAQLTRPAEQIVKALDPRLPLRDVATMHDRLRTSVTAPRLRTLLFALIAGLALSLSIVGIYGVMAYHVNQRRRETAIRRALGARVADVVGATMTTGLTLALTGVVVGTAGALMLTRWLSAMLFHVSPRDPAAIAAVAGLLAVAAALACGIPALRNARIEPASVLRDE